MPKLDPIYQVDRIKIENEGKFTVVDEAYGFSVRPGPKDRLRATLVEWAAQFMGFLSIFAMIGVVVKSTGLSGSAVDIFEVGILILGVTSATSFFFLGTRGTAVELQVDRTRRELRTAVRNWRGTDRIQDVTAMANVESAFVKSVGFPVSYGHYRIRKVNNPWPVTLVSGNVDSLHQLHDLVLRCMIEKGTAVPRVKSRPISFTGKVKATV